MKTLMLQEFCLLFWEKWIIYKFILEQAKCLCRLQEVFSEENDDKYQASNSCDPFGAQPRDPQH